MIYLWIKALHIISVICWMAAIFYLPRLFVYHAMAEDQASREQFKVMESKLLKVIMTPAMLATWVFGIWLLTFGISGVWFVAKFILVILMSAYHFWCASTVKKLANDSIQKSHVYFRWMNELPVVLMIAIVVLVVVKPF